MTTPAFLEAATLLFLRDGDHRIHHWTEDASIILRCEAAFDNELSANSGRANETIQEDS